MSDNKLVDKCVEDILQEPLAPLVHRNIVDEYNKHGIEATVSTVKSYMSSAGKDIPTSYKAVHKSVEGVINRFRQLNKSSTRPSGKQKLENFLDEAMTLPKPKSTNDIQRYPSFMSLCMPALVSNAVDMAQTYQSAAKGIAQELREIEEENVDLRNEQYIMEDQQTELIRKIGLVSKSKQKAETKLEVVEKEKTQLKDSLKGATSENKILLLKNVNVTRNLKRTGTALKAAKARETYHSTKRRHLEEDGGVRYL